MEGQAEPGKRRVVYVLGSDASTATTAGLLTALGMHAADPEWLDQLGQELFDRTLVHDGDARPSAWYDTGKLSQFERLRVRVSTWLEAQLAAVEAWTDPEQPERTIHPELVVHDRRVAWFTILWRSVAMRCGAPPAFAVVLRPVPQVVGPRGEDAFAQARATAAWLNLALHTERATRGSARAYLRHGDLLDDWTQPVFALGRRLDLAVVQEANANVQRAVHTLLEPERVTLRTATAPPTWDDLDVPARLAEIAREAEAVLDGLADDGGDVPAAHERLDALRTAYAAFYEEAAALSASTARAAFDAGRLGDELPGAAWVGRGAGSTPHPAAPTAEPVRRGRRSRAAVRALVPPGARRRLQGLRRPADRGR